MPAPEEHPDATFSRDPERGTDIPLPRQYEEQNPQHGRAPSHTSNSSSLSEAYSNIMGDPGSTFDYSTQAPQVDDWGPQHPCYPHLNPHVSIGSTEYATTRIIRIRRDWLLHGDRAPAFSDTYPEILDPAGLPELEFRRVVDNVNAQLRLAFDPYSLRNVLDIVAGLLTGWLWDDLGLTAIKSRLTNLDRWFDKWNDEIAKTTKANAAFGEGFLPPKLVSLRQTGYLTLDVQIYDPEIAPVVSAPDSTSVHSKSDLPSE